MRVFVIITLLLSCLSCSGATGNDVTGDLIERLALLEETVVSLQSKVRDQQNEIEALQSQRPCECNGGVAKRFIMEAEGPVAFSSVVDPVSVHHQKTDQIIQFETILTNYGDGYNNETGIFVVPVPGLYLVTCSVLDHLRTSTHGGNMVHAEIVKNHDVLARVFAHAERDMYRDQGANTIIVELNAGDQVYVRTVDNDDLGLGGQRYTSFSALLFWEL